MKSMKALKSLLVLGLICSTSGLVVKANNENVDVVTNENDVTNLAEEPVTNNLVTITIDGVEQNYTSLKDAFERKLEGDNIIIKLNQDLDFTEPGVYQKKTQTNGIYLEVATKDATVVLDLNGHNVTNHFVNPYGNHPARGFTLKMSGGTFNVINSSSNISQFDVGRIGQISGKKDNFVNFSFGDNIETNTKDLDFSNAVAKYSDFYLGFNGGFKGLQTDGTYNFYASASDAIKNSTNHTAILVNDYNGSDSFASSSNNEGIVDLNGKTFTTLSTVFNLLYSNINFTIKNGTINALNNSTQEYGPNVGFIGDAAQDVSNITLTLENITINSNYLRGIDFHGTDTDLHLNLINTTLNMTNENSYGIYMPAKNSTVNIQNSTIKAATAIVVKGGTLDVTDSKIESFGVENIPTEGANSGFNQTGDAIYVEGNYHFPISVNVNNSEILSENAEAMRDLFVDEAQKNTDILVKSGTFSSNVDKYLADSVKAKVESKEGNFSYYPSVDEAMNNAKPGDKIESIGDSAEPSQKVNVEFQDGSNTTTLSIPKGTELKWLVPSKNGYIFKGWSDGTTTYTTNQTYVVNSDIVFTAVWEKEPDKPVDPPYIPSRPVDTSDVSAETLEGDKVKVKEVKTDKDLEKALLAEDSVLTTIEVGKADEDVVVTYKAGRKYKDETFYVVTYDEELNKVIWLDKVEADEKGNVEIECAPNTEITLVKELKGWVIDEKLDYYFFDYETGKQQMERWVADGQDAKGNVNWYYLNEDGKLLTSAWIARDSKLEVWYYVNDNGLMLYDTTTPDGYYVDANGVWRA